MHETRDKVGVGSSCETDGVVQGIEEGNYPDFARSAHEKNFLVYSSLACLNTLEDLFGVQMIFSVHK